MELTDHHIMELMIVDYYTARYGHVTFSTMALNKCDSDLIYEGLIRMKGDGEIRYLFTTVEGKEVLWELGPGAVVAALYSLGKVELLHLCEDKVTLEDLPLLFASQDMLVREFAEKKYKELA